VPPDLAYSGHAPDSEPGVHAARSQRVGRPPVGNCRAQSAVDPGKVHMADLADLTVPSRLRDVEHLYPSRFTSAPGMIKALEL